MVKETTISPKLKRKMLEEQIDNIINEELGIADEVVKLADLIEKQVFSLLNQGITEKFFNVKTKLSDVNVDFIYKEFSNAEEALNWINKNGRSDGYSYQTNTIYLGVYLIGGVLNTFDLNDTIMHECSHYWECKKSGKTQYNDAYATIARGVSNWNPCISQLCEILYYCDKHEINSFVNGTYSTAMKKKKHYGSYRQFIADNGVSNLYVMLRDAEEIVRSLEIKNSSSFFIAAFWLISNGIFNCEAEEVVDKIIKIAQNAYQYLISRIGKAYALYTARLKEEEEKLRDAQIKMMLQRYKIGTENNEKEKGEI